MGSGINLVNGKIKIKEDDLSLFGQKFENRNDIQKIARIDSKDKPKAKARKILNLAGIKIRSKDNNNAVILNIIPDEVSGFFDDIINTLSEYVIEGFIEYDYFMEREKIVFKEGEKRVLLGDSVFDEQPDFTNQKELKEKSYEILTEVFFKKSLTKEELDKLTDKKMKSLIRDTFSMLPLSKVNYHTYGGAGFLTSKF